MNYRQTSRIDVAREPGCRRHRRLGLAWVLLALLPLQGHAQNSAAVQTLIEQGLYWQSTAEWPKAETAWEKVLLSDRNHPDALRGLFYFELQQGRVEEATVFRDRLAESEEAHPYLAIMNASLAKVTAGKPTLAEARRLVREDDVRAGLEQYRISFGEIPPNGPIALEYYTTLGGLDGGWQGAAEGLTRLSDAEPDDWAISLALGKHLTYRDASRRDGIDRLIALAEVPVARSAAVSAVRQALIWLPPRHADIPRYEAYLSLAPEDEELAKRLSVLRASRTPDQESLVQRGFAAIEDNSLDQAAERFERVLRSRPRDADALAGLGMVELRRGNFDAAAERLQRALDANGGNRSDWRRARDTARYWAIIETARQHIVDEEHEDARESLVQALAINEDEEVGLVMMAETLHELSRPEEAERFYLSAIEANPANAVALRGLGRLYNETERFDDAEVLALQLNEGASDGSDPVADEILAQGLVARARSLLEQGELDLAQVSLEKALKTQDTNPWIRLELAQLLLRRERGDRARLLMDEMATRMPDSASALHAQAEFAYLEGRYPDALSFLERVPPGERSPAMTATQNRIWLRLQVRRAVRFAQNNDFGEARRTLGAAENVAGSEPEMAGPLAAGWVELGEDERALSIMRTALKLNPDNNLQLQYAGLLLKTRKNEELRQVISNLKARRDLDEFQLRELSHIDVSYALRLSDRFLREKQYANAYATIEPYMDRDEEYPDIRMMLGRLYQSTGDDNQALANYQRILDEHPGHLDARRAAVGALIDTGSFASARVLVDEGLELFPEHPRMVLLAGQLEASEGHASRALTFYKQALTLVGSNTVLPGRVNGTGPSTGVGSNGLSALNGEERLLDVLDAPTALALESVIGLREEILTEIGRMNARTSSFFQLGGTLRNRSGESGLDKLSSFRVPAHFEYGLGNSGRLALDVAAESLDADDIQLGNTVATQRFGALALDTTLPREDTLSVSENGVSLHAGYQSRYFSIDAGTTPTDYAVSNVVGGLRATNAGERVRFSADLSRRAVEDSVLSYAGRLDPFLGITWGGVVRTGGSVDLTIDNDNQGFYGKVGAYAYDGENVASNTMSQLGAGVFWRLRDSEASRLRIGLDIDTFAFDENLSFHTFGHGGYFSPQSYVNLGVPVEWSGRSGALQFALTGKIGFERFEQDDVVYFPNDADLQLQLEALAQTADEPLRTVHRGNSNTGISLSLRGEVTYQVSPRLALGNTFALQRSGDFDETRIGLFARYFFSPQETRSISTANEGDQLLTLRGN